jgi:hypothetical protein
MMNNEGQSQRRQAIVWLLPLVMICWLAISYPSLLKLDRLFGDFGGSLRAVELHQRGVLLGVESPYAYGLLPVVVMSTVDRIVELDLERAVWLQHMFLLTVALGLVRISGVLRLPWAAQLVLLLTAVFVPLRNLSTATHAMEQAALVWAIFAHLSGRRGLAMALCVVAIYCKPAMGYVYGLVLTIAVVIDGVSSRRATSDVLRVFLPSLATAFGLGVVLAATTSVEAVARTLLPLHGSENYSRMGMGILGQGWLFFSPPGVNLNYYIGTRTGVFIAMTMLCLMGAALALFRARGKSIVGVTGSRREVLLAMAACHVAFLGLFFSNAWAAMNYPQFMVVGCCLLVSAMTRGWLLALALSLWLVVVNGVELRSVIREQRNMERIQPGVYADRTLRSEWEQMQQEIREGAAPLFTSAYLRGLMSDPEVRRVPFEIWWYAPGYETAKSLENVREMVRGSDRIVLWRGELFPFTAWDEVSGEFRPFSTAYDGAYFRLLQRAPHTMPSTGQSVQYPQVLSPGALRLWQLFNTKQ